MIGTKPTAIQRSSQICDLMYDHTTEINEERESWRVIELPIQFSNPRCQDLDEEKSSGYLLSLMKCIHDEESTRKYGVE
jgi:allophanate hydrolase subunit 1